MAQSIEELRRLPTVGFAFETPVPLPQLGHRFCHQTLAPSPRCPLRTLVFFELKSVEQQRVGAIKLSSSGLSYHDRDRFGVFAYSKVEVRIQCKIEDLLEFGLLHAFVVDPSGGLAFIKPTAAAHLFCANLFNAFVDLQTIAFDTHWVPHITPEDILSLAVMNWSDPENPETVGMLAGIPGSQRFIFGRSEGFPPKDLARILEVVERFPLTLWEELLTTALRDAEVGRFRSALMHACLGVEAYLRFVLSENVDRVPDPHFRDRTLKPLATRRGCMPALLGYSLDAGDAPSSIRDPFRRLAALRDAVMHTGNLVYADPTNGGAEVQIDRPEDVADYLDLALGLVRALSNELTKRGLRGTHRGMVPLKTERMNANEWFA